jgi:hypothetical protein
MGEPSAPVTSPSGRSATDRICGRPRLRAPRDFGAAKMSSESEILPAFPEERRTVAGLGTNWGRTGPNLAGRGATARACRNLFHARIRENG